MAQKNDINRLKYLMDLDEALRNAEKTIPKTSSLQLEKLKNKFYTLAGEEFDRSVLGEIYESAFDNIINKQADQYYSKSPKDIRKELVYSFTEMEHQRRRNNFLKYTESLFQQVECIVNFLFHKKDIEKYLTTKFNETFVVNGKPAYNETSPATVGKSLFDGKITRSDEIRSFISDDRDASITIKFKTVLYIFYYEGRVFYSPYKELLDIFNEIRQVRNFFHGYKSSKLDSDINIGNTLNYDQRIVDAARNDSSIKFLAYQGFLSTFTPKIFNSSNFKSL